MDQNLAIFLFFCVVALAAVGAYRKYTAPRKPRVIRQKGEEEVDESKRDR